ncbi:MAG: hypothetical protein K6F75_02455 [Butyrivibrio sp.]|nr:hypothetical protein [Butyrivibrio sp.]
MSRFTVDTDALKSAAGQCEGIGNNVWNLGNRILDVRNSLGGYMGHYGGVMSALDNCYTNSRVCSRNIKTYGSYGVTLAGKYETAENSIDGNIEYDKFGNFVVTNPNLYRSIFEKIGKWTTVMMAQFPMAFVPTSALLIALEALYGDDHTDAKVKITVKKKEWDDELEKAGFRWDPKIKKYYDKKTGKWLDEEDLPVKKEEKFEPEVEVKLKEVEKTFAKGSFLGEAGKISKEVEGEYGSASGEINVLSYDVNASAYVGLLSAGASVGATVTALSLDGEAQLGNDDLALYAKGDVTVGEASATAEAKVGLLDKNGNFNPSAKVEASAEVIGAKASGTIGGKVLGADVGVTGSVQVGVGAHANIGYEEGKLSLDVGATLGVGASVKLEIDVSKPVNAVCDGARAAWKWITGG